MVVISCYKAKSKDDIHEELIEDFNIYNDIEEVINNLHNLKQINKHLEVIGLFKELLSDQKQLRQEKELDDKIENITSGIYQDLSEASCNRSATNQLWKELIFYWKKTLFYFAVLSN
ncbi:hypothetical protein [Spiroplasma sp. ChiS]|uniref:hypothetical protein n=1 Tax=Spiroplasma sp. ChiS TaxID=2099885 RepID=UPI001F15A835|nr:hypothetical protein [Spiroplasma sp. ChiS]